MVLPRQSGGQRQASLCAARVLFLFVFLHRPPFCFPGDGKNTHRVCPRASTLWPFASPPKRNCPHKVESREDSSQRQARRELLRGPCVDIGGVQQEHRDEANTPIRHSIGPRERLRPGVGFDYSERKIVRIPASLSSPFRLSRQVQQLYEPRWAGSDRTQLSAMRSGSPALSHDVQCKITQHVAEGLGT